MDHVCSYFCVLVVSYSNNYVFMYYNDNFEKKQLLLEIHPQQKMKKVYMADRIVDNVCIFVDDICVQAQVKRIIIQH